MRAIDRWRSLDGDEQRLTFGFAIAAATVALLLRLVSVQRLLRVASRPVRGSAITDHGIEMRVRAMDRAARYVPGVTCLATSIGLTWMLRRRGVPAEIRIGVRREAGLSAHAWVERGGEPLTRAEGAAGRFTVVNG